MRWLCLVVLVGCMHAVSDPPLDQPCPGPQPGSSGDTLAGTSCAGYVEGRMCFVENDFSSCASSWYRCESGAWQVDHSLGAVDGQSCAGAPIASCMTEGNFDCTTAPTAQSCQCGSDGIWHCDCACYGGQTTCPTACPSEFPGVGSTFPQCADVGTTCSYGAHTCTCTANPHDPSTNTFSCT